MRMMLVLFSMLFVTPTFANSVDESIRASLKWKNTELAGTISDYAVITSMVGTIGYTVAHNDEKRWERTGAVVGAYALNAGVNQLVKRAVGRERPNKANNASFYSGHTSTAFVGAGALCLQKDKALCATALGLAATVGYLRMAADWHWFSDVAVGAGVGYAMGRFVPTIFIAF